MAMEIQRTARSRRMSIAEWVRQALDLARRRELIGSLEKKLETVRRAVQHRYPAGDIDSMLAENRSGIYTRFAAVILIDSNIPKYLVGAPHHIG